MERIWWTISFAQARKVRRTSHSVTASGLTDKSPLVFAASYDIEKEEEVVAVLTLFKSAFRLGETVSGVVTFNAESCRRRVLKVSCCHPSRLGTLLPC